MNKNDSGLWIILIVLGANALALLVVRWLIRTPTRTIIEIRDHRDDPPLKG